MGYEIKDSGDKTKFSTGAVRDLRAGKGRFDLLPPATIKALAIHFEKGAEKYEERNWEKGIPVSKYLDSALRHTFQVLDGLKDENHLISAIWNLVCAYETILRVQRKQLPEELLDLPNRTELPDPYGRHQKCIRCGKEAKGKRGFCPHCGEWNDNEAT